MWPGPEMATALIKAFHIELRDLYDLTATRVVPSLSIEEHLALFPFNVGVCRDIGKLKTLQTHPFDPFLALPVLLCVPCARHSRRNFGQIE